MQYATAREGVRIAFGTAGKGSPLIVRVPSLPFVHSQLEWSQGSEFFDQLAENWTVVQYDPRGTGLSDRNVQDFSLETRLLDVEAVVEKLGVRRFALHGIGWGGPLAVTYAVRNPDRVSHLILDDTQARTEDFFNIPQMRVLDQLTTEWEAFLEYLAFMIYGVGREEGRPVVKFLDACVTQETLQLISQAARHDDVTDLLSQLSMPTLIVQHSGVSGQYLESARDMAVRIPDARLAMLEGMPVADLTKLIGAIGDLLGTETRDTERGRAEGRHEESGVRTILFTDMVEHTPMMHRLGDKAGRDVLREHEHLTRDVLRARRVGGEVDGRWVHGFLRVAGRRGRVRDHAAASVRGTASRAGCGPREGTNTYSNRSERRRADRRGRGPLRRHRDHGLQDRHSREERRDSRVGCRTRALLRQGLPLCRPR